MDKQYCAPSRVQLSVKQIRAVAFEIPLNNRECMRAEIVQRKKLVVVVSRWKTVGGAYQRTGKDLHFAERHLDSMLDLLGHLQVTRKNLAQDSLARTHVTGGHDIESDCGCDSACWGERETSAPGSTIKVIAEKPGEAETTTPRRENETPKRQRGRPRSLTPEQIEVGIGILRNQPKMKIEAACATLCDAGIKASRSALYRLVYVLAYPRASEQTPPAQSTQRSVLISK